MYPYTASRRRCGPTPGRRANPMAGYGYLGGAGWNDRHGRYYSGPQDHYDSYADLHAYETDLRSHRGISDRERMARWRDRLAFEELDQQGRIARWSSMRDADRLRLGLGEASFWGSRITGAHTWRPRAHLPRHHVFSTWGHDRLPLSTGLVGRYSDLWQDRRLALDEDRLLRQEDRLDRDRYWRDEDRLLRQEDRLVRDEDRIDDLRFRQDEARYLRDEDRYLRDEDRFEREEDRLDRQEDLIYRDGVDDDLAYRAERDFDDDLAFERAEDRYERDVDYDSIY